MSTPRIDAHQHFWTLARGDYGWLTPDLVPLYRDFGPPDLGRHLDAAGVETTVLVQAADTLEETGFLLDLAARTPFVAGVVGWVPMDAPDAAQAIGRLAESGPLLGVRPMLQDLDDDAWILRADLAPAVRALVRHGLAFDALVTPRHLRHLVEFAARHPDLRIVIDHAAKPDVAAGAAGPGFAAWRDHLRALAGHPRVHCKLSGLVTEAAAAWTVDDLRPFVETVLDLFGPARTLWGSDWPVCLLAGGYDAWWSATEALLGALAPDARDDVLGGAAARFYGLGARVP